MPARLGQCAHQFLQRLAFELANSLTGQAQVLADLAQRHRLVRLEAEPHANHGGLTILERVQVQEDAVEVVGLDHLRFRAFAAIVGQDAIECGPVLIQVFRVRREVVDPDRLGHDSHLLLRETQGFPHLVVSRGPAQSIGQHRRRSPPLGEQADHVRRQPDRFPCIHHRPTDRLLDPVTRVGAETSLHHAVKSFDSTHQSQIPFFDQILQIQAFAQIATCDIDDQPQVGFDHVLACDGITHRHALGKRSLLLRRKAAACR